MLSIIMTGCSTETHQKRSSCGTALTAKWPGHALGLSNCAGQVGLDDAYVTVSLDPGEQLTLTAPSGGEPILTNIHSSDAGVVAAGTSGTGLARFRAVRPGTANIIGDTPYCLDWAAAACAVAHIVVAAKQ